MASTQPSYYSDMGSTGLNMHSGAALPRTPLMHNRMRRRQSRELPMPQEDYSHLANAEVTPAAAPSIANAPETNPDRRKPEQMRSVSEDSGAKTTPKPVTRRSFSHPEKESTVSTLSK